MDTLLAGIRGNRYLVFGRAGMDLYADPIGTKSEHAGNFHADLGGSSANICVGLVKLGAKATLVTSVSDDAVGRFCVNRLREYGVDTEYVNVVGGEHRTSLAIYESCLEDFQNVIYRNQAADFQVTDQDVLAADYSAFSAVILTGTVFAADPSRTSSFEAIAAAQKAGLPIIFDIDYRPYSWPSKKFAAEVLSRAAAQSDLIVGNDEEFGFMAGEVERGLGKARSLARQGKLVIYKMGQSGAIALWGDDEIRTGIFPVKAVKPNGAGDSFMAGFLASLAACKSLREAVLDGSACAAIVVAKPGCASAMPTWTELEDFVHRHPGATAL